MKEEAATFSESLIASYYTRGCRIPEGSKSLRYILKSHRIALLTNLSLLATSTLSAKLLSFIIKKPSQLTTVYRFQLRRPRTPGSIPGKKIFFSLNTLPYVELMELFFRIGIVSIFFVIDLLFYLQLRLVLA